MTEEVTRTDEEPRVDVYFVKVNDTQAGVIVSFTDAGDEDPAGIYLYEPGVDPVELNSVGIDGDASEFEYATVIAWHTEKCSSGPDQDFETTFPGDGMVTFAQRDVAVSAAVEGHDTLVDSHEELKKQAQALVDAVKRGHASHSDEAIQWCPSPACQAAHTMEL